MAKQTVHRQMAEALEGYIKGVETAEHLAGPANTYDWRGFARDYRDLLQGILDRHRAEPECGGGYGVLWETLGRLFAWEDDPRSIPIGMWSAAYNAFKAARSEPHCDTSCPCYQEGLEAQREPAGRGTA